MTNPTSTLNTVHLSVAIVFLMTASPTLRAEEVQPTEEEVVKMASAQTGERWYGIYVLGKKVGWQRETWETADDKVCSETEFSLKMSFLGKANSITVSERSCYYITPPFYQASFLQVKNEGGRLISVEGKKEGEELVYQIDTGAKKRVSRVSLDSDLLSHVLSHACLERMKPGDTIDSFSFDELTARKRWQKLTLKSLEKKSLRGKKQTVYKVLIEDELGMKLDTLITNDGIVLEGSMGPSMRIVLEDKKTAVRTDLDLLDLYSTSFIRATGEFDFGKVSEVRRLKLKLIGESPLALAANRRQKVVEEGESHIVLEISACPTASEEEKPTKEHLRCNAEIPCDVAEYKELVKKVIQGAKSNVDKANALSRWVHTNFKYRLGEGGSTGDLILKEKVGDCTEYSKAVITLLRAAGLHARQLSGVVPASAEPLSFGYHAWAEVWLEGEGWTAVDPTWGYYPVDAAHIVFDVEEGLQMFAHLGGLTIEVLEVEYSSEQGALKCD